MERLRSHFSCSAQAWSAHDVLLVLITEDAHTFIGCRIDHKRYGVSELMKCLIQLLDCYCIDDVPQVQGEGPRYAASTDYAS